MDLPTLLANCQNPDHAVRKQAEDALHQAGDQDMGNLLLALVSELANEQQQDVIRQQAGMYVKLQLSAEDMAIRRQKLQQWALVDASVKNQIKAGVLQSVHSSSQGARTTAGLIIGKMGAIELAKHEWPDLLQTLLGNVTGSFEDGVKVATLQALGYMCDEWQVDDMEQAVTDQILTCIVDGMRTDRPSPIRLAAVNALVTSLDFCQKNFDSQQERDMIMQVVCEATQCEDPNVRKSAYECIWNVATLYYDRLQAYMRVLFELTLKTIKEDVDEVALNAMEFWSTLCDEEIEIKEDTMYGEGEPQRVSHDYVQAALPTLMPLVLETMAKQEEDSAEDATWDTAKSAATCLRLMANLLEDQVVDAIVPFVTTNIESENWHLREAAVMAFGAVLEGPSPDKLAPLVSSALPVLINRTQDPNVLVKDTAVWTLGKICEVHGASLSSEALDPLVTALGKALDDTPRVVSKACYALHHFGEQFEPAKDEPTNPLSGYLSPLVQKLLQVAQRDDAGEANVRGSAVEAMNVLIKNSAQDMRPVIHSTLDVVLQMLEGSFSIQCLTADDREKVQGLQILLCGSVQIVCLKLGKDVQQYADKIMRLLLEVFKNKEAVAQEEAFMAVGALADQLEKDFMNYMPTFQPILEQGLSNYEEYQVCVVAVGVVSDLCRALEAQVRPFTDNIVTHLLRNLENPNINRSVKPPVLACLGDVALAISGEFEVYLSVTMNMLVQAQGAYAASDPSDDEDMNEFINQLREGVLEAYSGIVQGLNEQDNCKSQLLAPYLPGLVAFLELVAADESKEETVLRHAIGVVGDIATTIGEAKNLLKTPAIQRLLEDGAIKSDEDSTKQLATWAHQMLMAP